ncbi:hypothetical protein D3C83_00010 [compost metagenome]
MEPGSKRRILQGRPATAVPAADHGRDLWLRGRQRRGAIARAELAVELDAPAARGQKDEPCFRPRQADVPRPGQPQDTRVRSRVRRRSDPVRGEPGTLGAARGAEPVAVPRPGAGRADGADAVPADRRIALPADAAVVRLLLVSARRAGRRRGPELARRAARTRGSAMAGAVRRLDELLPRSRGAVADCHGGEDARGARDRGAAALHREAAMVCGEGRAGETRRPRGLGAVGRGPRQLDDGAAQCRERRGVRHLFRAAFAGVGGARGGARARAGIGDGRQGAAAGAARPGRRRARR